MEDYKFKTSKTEKAVVDIYKKIENGVVDTYKKIEEKFVDNFLENANTSNEKSTVEEDN